MSESVIASAYLDDEGNACLKLVRVYASGASDEFPFEVNQYVEIVTESSFSELRIDSVEG